METAFLEFIRNVYDVIGWPGIVALMAIESACLPLPSELIMPLAGWFLIQEKGLGIEWVFLAAFCGALGNLIGSLAAYWVGAAGGRPLILRYGRYVLISAHDLDRADRLFAKHGDKIIFLSRLLPVVRTFISMPAGVTKMNLARFSVLTFLGSYPFSFGLAYGRYKLGEHWERLRDFMRPAEIPIIILIAIMVLWYAWRHYRRAWHLKGHTTE